MPHRAPTTTRNRARGGTGIVSDRVDDLLAEDFDLVHVRASTWGSDPPLTQSLVRLDFEFQGLALPLAVARQRRRAIDRHGVSVMSVPVSYRGRGLDATRLAGLAGQALAEARASHPDAHLEPLRLYADHPIYATYLAPAAHADGCSRFPAGLLLAVDKLDGSLWTEPELERFFVATGR